MDRVQGEDFIGSRDPDETFACGPDLTEELAGVYAAASAFVAFLCEAVELPY